MKLKVINSGSKGNGYALISEDEILLLECGVPAKEMLKSIDYQVGNVVGCISSHSHGDHLKFIKQYMSYGIKVYTSDEVYTDVQKIYGEKTVPLARMKSQNLGNFKVIPFHVPHNGTECDGWIVEHEQIGKLLFITDAEYCPYDFSKYGINHALLECNYCEDYIDSEAENRSHVFLGHMEFQTCKRLIETINTESLRTVGLLHLSPCNGNPVRFRNEIKELVDCDVNVFVAEKGHETELGLLPF